MRNVDEMFVAEMQAVEDDYREKAEELRDKMVEELMSKSQEKSQIENTHISVGDWGEIPCSPRKV